jgi:hypothetical protein
MSLGPTEFAAGQQLEELHYAHLDPDNLPEIVGDWNGYAMYPGEHEDDTRRRLIAYKSLSIGDNPELTPPTDGSLGFFMDPKHYQPFDLSKDYKRMLGCIDPRDEESADVKVLVQTPGGSAGEAHDAALARTMITGKTVGMIDGLYEAHKSHLATVMGAHVSCKFIDGITSILAEESTPTDFTRDSVERWAKYYQLADDVLPNLGAISIAALMQQETAAKLDPETLLNLTDELSPKHANIARMVGVNNARVYVVNHHPYVGLDRESKRQYRRLEIQGYHDSLRAAIEGLKNTTSVNAQERGLRLTALMLRSAAARTVLGSLHDDTQYVEVKPGEDGLKFEKLAA